MLRLGGSTARVAGRCARTSSRFFFSSTTTESNGETKTSEGSPEQPTPEEDPVVKLTKENRELKEKLLRAYAEEENVRRIARKDVENAKAYANSSFAKGLLDVADNLERAMDAVPAESQASSDPVIKNLLIGVKMTDADLSKVFAKFGVIKYGEIGEKFDPVLHEALYQIPDASAVPNTIGKVLKPGYRLKDRVIRAAEVGTYTAPVDAST